MIDILQFVHSFIPLLNTHSNDFLLVDLWDTFLPASVRSVLDDIENPEMILTKYLQYTETALPFDCQLTKTDFDWNALVDPDKHVVDRQILPNWETVSFDLDTFIRTCAGFSRFAAFTDSKNENLSDNFIDHEMNEKKSYEVEKMSSLCGIVCDKYDITNIVDIGSGRGYLGSDLSISKGYNVIELDAKESNSASALKRRDRLARQLPSIKKKQKKILPTTAGACRSIVRMITPTDTLSRILIDEGCHETGYLLTGLHCCGGLSSTVLTNFVASDDAKAVAIVGCCYHLLRERFVKNFSHDCPTEAADFPMSRRLTDVGVVLGRNAKTFASQSVRRIAREAVPIHASMFHRVLLQRLLSDRLGYADDDWIVGKIGRKMGNSDSFEEYARAACVRLGLDAVVEDVSFLSFVCVCVSSVFCLVCVSSVFCVPWNIWSTESNLIN